MEKYEDLYKTLEHIPVSAGLDLALDVGIRKYDKEKMKKKRLISSTLLVAVLMISLVSAVRLFPNVAHAMSQIPFLKPLIEMINYDRGIQDIIDNEYFEEMNFSSTVDGITLTVTGVVADEYGMIVTYELKSPKDLTYYSISPGLMQDRESIKAATSSDTFISEKQEHYFQGSIKAQSVEALNFTSNKFELVMDFEGKALEKKKIVIPFEITKEMEPSRIFELNEKVEIEGQRLTIKELIISPLSARLKVELDATNTKQILSMNVELLDENKDVWGGVINGVSTFGSYRDNEPVIMLVSNYYRTPKELTILLSEIEIIDKKEEVIVDLVKQEVVKNTINLPIKVLGDWTIDYNILSTEKSFLSGIFAGGVDVNGNELYSPYSETSMTETGSHVREKLESVEYDKIITQPIKLHFFKSYQYLEGKVEIKVKTNS